MESLKFKPIYLYIKTHNKTGLKYLGKTIQDPFVYKGSGKRWKNHLKKHGYNVTTEIVGIFFCLKKLKNFAAQLSKDLDIVNSKEWANLVPELGEGGDTSKYIDYSNLNRNKGKSYEEIYGKEKAIELKKLRGGEITKRRKNKTWEQIFGKEKAEIMRETASKRMLERTSRLHTEEVKYKLRQKALGRVHPRCSCIICKKELSINNVSNHYKIHKSC
jgi:hypothetical protein